MNICTKNKQIYCELCLHLAESYICDYCYQRLPWVGFQCSRCHRPLSDNGLICAQCQAEPYAFDAVLVPFCYEKPISTLIQDLKFRNRPFNARLLAGLFLDHLPKDTLPHLIIPMPMHPLKIFQRTFNQTMALGDLLADQLGIPMDWQTLTRSQHRPAQRELTHVERKNNLKHAFALNRPLPGLHIALLDDVITTGYSAHYASLCLKQGGAARVDVWAMATTPVDA